MKKTHEYFIVFSFGAVLYGLTEVLFRGHTHWTMLLLGGIVFSALYFLDVLMQKTNYILKCLAGSAVISSMEFVCGYVVNIRLKMQVWDYSGIRFNLLGQVCPKYAAVWFMLCVPAFVISSFIRKKAICR
ncbi:MAG: hypothetical protein IJS17_05275 [Clostridia bacterium]|nr:hypothetical protein [Clostridia bacterium]